MQAQILPKTAMMAGVDHAHTTVDNSDVVARQMTTAFGAYIRGSERAYIELWDHIIPILTRYVRKRHLRQMGDAWCDDVVQNSMLKAHIARNTVTLDGGCEQQYKSMLAWFLLIARNAAYDQLRRKGAENRMHEAVLHEPQIPADEIQARNELIEELSARVDALPEGQRAIVHAHVYEGLSMAEIATRECVREGAIRTRASRAYAALRASFKADGDR